SAIAPAAIGLVEPAHLIRFARKVDLSFRAGQGAYLTGSDGRRYLDFFAGIGVSCLGHQHPRLLAALSRAAHAPWHVSNGYRVESQEALAAKLCAHSFAERVFFCNSGLEAAEAAIKMARRFHFEAGATDRIRVVTLRGAFHGRSLAALAA